MEDDNQCEHEPYYDDTSFDHAFGTKVEGRWKCAICDEVLEIDEPNPATLRGIDDEY